MPVKIDISAFDEPVSKQKVGDIDISAFDEDVKKKSTPSGYSVTPLPSQDKFKLGQEVATIGYKSPLGKAIQKDKEPSGSNLAAAYNLFINGLAEITGGSASMADILTPVAPLPLNVRIANAQDSYKKVGDFINQARIEKGFPIITPTSVDWISSSKEFENKQGAIDVAPKDGQGIFSGVDWEDVRGLAINAPNLISQTLLGGLTGGYTFGAQSVYSSFKDFEETGAKDKLTDLQKIGYIFTQGAAQAALEKYSIDKILKNTGLAKTLQKKIASEVIDEFAKKGIKATAQDIENEMFKKAAKLSTKIKNVGIKAFESTIVESSTEGTQQAASDAIKLATNKIAKDEVFDEEDINKNFWKNIVNNAVVGGVMGGVMGGGLQGLNSTDKAIRQEIANATGEKKFYVDDQEVTEKEFNQATGNKKVTTDLQHIQDQINQQVEEGNLTPEEAQAANITAQQYAEIAGKIPATVSPEDKYKIIGGISQRNKLQQDLQTARDEMMQVDPIFRKEKQDQVDLIQAKIEETNNYLEGIASGKEPKYKERRGMYFKVNAEGEEIPVSKETYDLANAVKKNDENKINDFVNRIASGEKMETPEDLQFYDNNKKAIESALQQKAKEEKPVKPVIRTTGTVVPMEEIAGKPKVKVTEEVKPTEVKDGFDYVRNKFIEDVSGGKRLSDKESNILNKEVDKLIERAEKENGVKRNELKQSTWKTNDGYTVTEFFENGRGGTRITTPKGEEINIFDNKYKGESGKDISYFPKAAEVKPTEVKEEVKAEEPIVAEVKPEVKSKLEAFKTKFAPKEKELTPEEQRRRDVGLRAAGTRKDIQEANKIQPTDEHSAVLSWLSAGNKLNWEAINEAAGKRQGAELNIDRDFNSEEVQARDYAGKTKDEGMSIVDAVHEIWENLKQQTKNENFSDRDVKNFLLDAVREYTSKKDAAKKLVQLFSEKPISIEEQQAAYYERQGEQAQPTENIQIEGGFKPVEGIEEFAVKEPTTEELDAMEDIVADYVKDGVTALPDIKKAIAKELGYNTKVLRQTIEDAYNSYTTSKEAAPKEILGGILGRISNKMSQMFGRESQKPYIAKDSKSIKAKYQDISETGGRPAFQIKLPNGESVTAKPVDASVVNGFYSPLELQINQMKADKMPAKQWLEKLRGEEAKWTGLADWLSQQEGSLTKENIKFWLEDNQIQINEIIKGEPNINNKEFWEYQAAGDGIWNFNFEKNGRGLQIDASEGDGFARLYVKSGGYAGQYNYNEIASFPYNDRNDILDMALEKAYFEDYLDEDLSSTKYSKYTLDGEKKDYKEILITYPTGPDVTSNLTFEQWNKNRMSWGEKEGTLDEYKKAGVLYKSSHFDEKNILVHIRTDIRTDLKGNKIYFIEEVQSDWGQEGKKKGFSEATLKEIQRYNELKSVMSILEDTYRDIHRATNYAYKYDVSTSAEEFYKLSIQERKNKISKTHEKYQNRTNQYIDYFQKLINDRNKKINDNIDEELLLQKKEYQLSKFLETVKTTREFNQANKELEELDIKIRNIGQESVKLEEENNTDSKMIDRLNIDKSIDNFEYDFATKAAEIKFDKDEYAKITNEYQSLTDKIEKTSIKKAPFVTKTNDWAKLGLKVALKNAIESGAKKIAWTNGEQQNERYDLSKQVNYIERIPENDINKEQGDFYLDINLPNGIIGLNVNKDSGTITRSTGSVYRGDLIGKSLSDVIGKDMADKIMQNGAKKYEGDGLRIGGKGMIGFYGSTETNDLGILGNLAKSLYKQEPKKISFDDIKEKKLQKLKEELKEHTANKTYWFEMADFARRTGDLEEAEKNEKVAKKSVQYEEDVLKEIKKLKTEYQYSIDITPELKQQVQQGLPLFMANQNGTDVLGFSFNNRMYLNGEKLNPNTIIHEAGHIWTEWIKNNDTKVYEKGLELVEKSPYLIKAKNSKFYQEQAEKLTTQEEKDIYFKHEALAMAIGDKGAQFVLESKKANFKEWLKTLWSKIKNLTGFKDLTEEEFQNLTFEEFTKKAVKEILGTENQLDKFEAMKSFRSKKNFVKANLKYESNKKAIDDLDFTEQDLYDIVKSNFDLSTFKNIKDAVQKRSAKKILQRPQGGIGETRGGRKRVEPSLQGEGITGEGKGETTQPQGTTQIPEEIENVGLDNQDVNYVGITEADINDLRKSLGLPRYKGLPTETHSMLRDVAQEMINKGIDVQSLYDKIRRGDALSNYENAFMAEYRAALDVELKNNPTKELLAKIKEFADTFQVGASLAGKGLESLKIMKKLNEANTLSNFLLTRQEDKGFTLTPKMIAEETAKFEKVQKAKKDLKESANNDIEEQIKAEAESELKGEKKVKKSHEEFVKERKEALAAAREALKKLRSGEQGLMVSVPGLNEIIAVAPHMNKYAKSLFAEGVSKLDDIVTEVHSEFSDLIDGLTKRDVLDVIAGKYNLKKKTENEINAGLRLLRREAELLIKLEQARKGEEEAKSESQMAEKSKRIQDLERKIKEVRELNRAKEMAEEGVAENSPFLNKKDLTEAEYNQRRQKFLDKKIKKLEDDLKNKNYDKETKELPKYKASEKTKKMLDKVIELEKAIALERYKDQTNKLSKWERAWDKIQSILGVRRIVQTAIDASIWFRQLAKLTLNPRKWDIAKKFISAGGQSVFSQKNYDRLMYGIHQAPDFKESVEDGIRYNELDSIDPKKQNEMFPKSFVFKIPILRDLITASQRIADASLNVARYELYNKYKKDLLSKGITRESDPKVYEEMAKLVMNSTGSGNMLKFLESRQGEKVMGSIFYGARLMAANMNTLNPAYYVRMPKEVRNMAMKDLASYTSTILVTTLALAAAGGTVTMDPDDPEFLQVRFGGKVYDLTAGQAAYIRTFLRWVEAGYAKATKSKFEGNQASDFAWKSTLNFFRNKLAPNNAYIANAWADKNSIGQDFDPMEIFHIYPMYADDAYKAAKEDGILSLFTVLMPNILGIGYASYYSDRAMKPMDEVISKAQDSDEMNPVTIRKDITKEEFKEFAKLRDKLIADKITELYKEGIFDEETGEQIPIKKATGEQITKAILSLKREATMEAKDEFNADEED